MGFNSGFKGLMQSVVLEILFTSHIYIYIYIRGHIYIPIFIHTILQNHYIIRKSARLSFSEPESRQRDFVSYGENSELISPLKRVMSLWLIESSLSLVGDPIWQVSGTMLADVASCSVRSQVVRKCVHVSVSGCYALRQVHSLFQTEFSTQCNLVFPPLNSITFSLPYGQPVAVYVILLLFSSLPCFLVSDNYRKFNVHGSVHRNNILVYNSN